MIKIDRCKTAPKSLAVEASKKYGSYNQPDVLQQLREDSNDKCYICELQGISDPQVEHLKPHYNRTIKERVFDWDNLFYACPHCNNMKNRKCYEEKIWDCSKNDPELVLEHTLINGHVIIKPIINNEIVEQTADLIQNCFEKTNTGIREMACQYRTEKLSEVMNVFYKTLQKYKMNPDSKRYWKCLKVFLNRKSEFAAFKRCYLRTHLKEYPALEELLE